MSFTKSLSLSESSLRMLISTASSADISSTCFSPVKNFSSVMPNALQAFSIILSEGCLLPVDHEAIVDWGIPLYLDSPYCDYPYSVAISNILDAASKDLLSAIRISL